MPHKDPKARRAYQRQWEREWRQKNPEKARAKGREDARKARAKSPKRLWSPEEKALASTQALKYYYAHIEQCKARHLAWKRKNKAHVNAYARTYRQSHPEQHSAHAKAVRARHAQSPVNDFSAAQWQEMQAAYDHRCHYCGKRCKGHLTQDHIVALSKGGSHTYSNIVPACRSCNSSKKGGPPPAAVQPLLLMIALPKKKRR